jgi:hypothetical protein
MVETRASETMFKRGELDFKTVLNKQLDRILEKLTEGEYDKFSNGVEALYLVLYYYLEKDSDFLADDKKVMESISDNVKDIITDLRLMSEDKEVRLNSIGVQSSKLRLALIDRVLGRRRMLLESRRLWDEREPGTTAPGEPTEEELGAIVGSSPAEE